MDNRNTFFNKTPSTETLKESVDVTTTASEVVTTTREILVEPLLTPPITAVAVAPVAPIKTPSILSIILSKVKGNGTILQLILLGAVFFMGNQFGSGCQRQKEIRQQIKMIEREHLATLKLVDSLQRASAEQEAKTLQQVTDFYATLQQLDLKSEVVKTQLTKAKAAIDVRKSEAVKLATEHNDVLKDRISQGAKRSSYFDLITEDSLAIK